MNKRLEEIEHRLREKEQYLNLALAAGKIGIWDLDLTTGITHLTAQAAANLGFEPVEAHYTQSQITSIIHPLDLPEANRRMAESTAKHEAYDFTVRIIACDGRIKWVASNASVFFGSDGKALRMIGTNIDVTASKEAEAVLEDNQRRLRLFLDALPVQLWSTSPLGEVRFYNRFWYEYTGLSQTNGTTLTELGSKVIHPDDVERVTAAWGQHMAEGSDIDIEVRVRRKDGEYRWHLMRGTPVRNARGEIEDWTGLAADIESLKEAQYKAQEASRLKSTFLANMSHEIRTPMTAVLGFTDVLRDSQVSEEDRKDALSRIDNSGRALLRLIDDVLDISKIEAGKLLIQKARFSPVEIASEVIGVMRLAADQKGIELRLQVDASVPSFAFTDPARIRQILMNLVGNAVKFTSAGHVGLLIRAESESTLIFEVEDTGIGISEEDRGKLFYPFAQADASITRTFGGTGLGLLLSLRLAEQLGGSLELKSSTLGKGSCFEARVDAAPFSREPHSEICRVDLGEKAQGQDLAALEGVRILLAEDVPDNQVLMLRYLTSAGGEVQIAANGEEAIAKATHGKFHVVLMDIQMPKVDGIQATKALRGKGYRGPILALTAHAMPEEVLRSIEAGCNAHLTKPIAKSALLSTIRKFAMPEQVIP